MDRYEKVAKEIGGMLGILRGNHIYEATGEHLSTGEFGNIMANEITSIMGCREVSFNLYPGKDNDLAKEDIYFIAAESIPMVERYGSRELMKYDIDATFKDLCERVNDKNKRAVVITSDWNADALDRWRGKINEIQERVDLRTYLTRTDKASKICIESTGSDGNINLNSSAAKSSYGECLCTLLKILKNSKTSDAIKTDEIIEVMANLTGISKVDLKRNSYSNVISSSNKAFIFGISSLKLEYSDLEPIEYPYFTQAIKKMITHAQGRHAHKMTDVTLVVDQWSGKEAEYWRHNIEAISKEVHLEMFLLAGDTLNFIK